MIGVVADPAEHDVVREFFELFKTPWEFYRSDRQYDVLLCAEDCDLKGSAKLVILYGGRKLDSDRARNGQERQPRGTHRILAYKGKRVPIYGDAVTFPAEGSGFLADEVSHESAAFVERFGEGTLIRIGYDLFSEIRFLLTVGQPAINADLPALDLHIAVLIDLITGCGISLIEIPPVPDGYKFIACLTHDVDHPSIRQHKWDHTMFGFLYRALFGSVVKLFRGKMSFRDLAKNWWAALKLPLVHLGLAKDIWCDFDDQYLEIENGLPSTFFLIPFKNSTGKGLYAPPNKLRAAQYGAADFTDAIKKLTNSGCEVGLHGIDAWSDSSQASVELEEIRRLTGRSSIGVRMHWLYYDERSPAVLDQTEADYDSTIGYNETTGYRAGTAQAYKPLNATRLLELPMHVMDTALFYPAYLALSAEQARSVLDRLMDNAAAFGGCLTINWHDRSMAPERLWGASYRDLLEDLKRRGAWFATAGKATSWFQKRRSIVFEVDELDSTAARVKPPLHQDDSLPGLTMRIHKGQQLGVIGISDLRHLDTPLREWVESQACSVGR